jgi:hypothetical protein
LLRLNKGGGPIIDSSPLPGVVERFGLFTTSTFNDGRWYTTDSEEFTDTALTPAATANGTNFRFTLTNAETYLFELQRLSDSKVLFSRSGTLNNSGAGAIDTVEIALFNNGSSDDGTREFFFDSLRIESPIEFLPGDYNRNGEVDAADYLLWRDTLSQSVPVGSGADGDNSGVIDTHDYDVWRAQFGNTVMSAGSRAANLVPESTGIVSVLFAYGFISQVLLFRRTTALAFSSGIVS